MIEVAHARKSYPGSIGRPAREAVRDVSMTVAPGSVHGLLGRNGAGKTTTVKMLLGLVGADGGRFLVAGEDARTPAGRKRVGFLPEQPYYPGATTARRLLARYARLSGVRSATGDKVAAMLASVGLEPHADVQLSKYSRGMLQRFGIAQALIGEPDVVILDEPASGLDPVGQRDVRDVIASLRERGVTVLLSSHQLSEVEAVCDTVTIVDDGIVAAEGELEALLAVEGMTTVVASGLDELPARVVDVGSSVDQRGGCWTIDLPDDGLRAVVDEVSDVGGRIVSVLPKRDQLDDLFDRLLKDRTTGSDGGGRG